MRNAIFITCLSLASGLLGWSFAPPKEVVRTVTVTKTVEVPGETVTVPGKPIEKIIHDPADAVRIGELESQLREALNGWRAAEARYKYYETYWEPKQAAQPAVAAGAQGSASAVYPRPRLFGGRR